MKKRILTIVTVYEDGSYTIIEPGKTVISADGTDDSTPPDDTDPGGDRPPTGPKTP